VLIDVEVHGTVHASIPWAAVIITVRTCISARFTSPINETTRENRESGETEDKYALFSTMYSYIRIIRYDIEIFIYEESDTLNIRYNTVYS